MNNKTEVLIVGAGVGGLTLALSLHQAGISCRVYEAVREIKPLGVGINILPHATRELDELGLLEALDQVGIRTKESIFFNRFGQFIYSEPAGMAAGYDWPQFSIHRGDLQMVLLQAVRKRLGNDAVITDARCTKVDLHDDHVQLILLITRQRHCLRYRQPLLSAAMAFIQLCASSFIRMKARPSIPVLICGGG